MMNKITIYNKNFYYFDADDPVIEILKNGQLFGLDNYLLLKSFTADLSGWVIDCGAHIGTFGFVPVLEKHKVLLIEGAKQNYECLKATFEFFDNAIIENAIVLDKKQNCNFPSNYGPFGSPEIKENGEEESTTIDEICLKHNIEKVSMIKIDIEGFEEEALSGAGNIINKNKPVMLLEVNGHCLRLRDKKPRDILQKIEQMNYISFIINGPILIPVDKDKKFPFCNIDIICIHRHNIHQYIGYSQFSNYLSDDHIKKTSEQNYSGSNEDCRKYFESIE